MILFIGREEITKIFVTPKCTLNCGYCFKDKRKKNPTIQEIIRQIDSAKGKVLFKGGDALLYPRIKKVLRYAKNCKLNVAVETTGIIFNEELLDYIDEFYFVFDTIIFEDWKKITRKSKEEYDATLRSIFLAKEAGKKINIDSLLTKLSYPSLEKTSRFCYQNAFTLRILKNKYIPGFKYSNDLIMPLKEARKLLGNPNFIQYISVSKKKSASEKYYRRKK